MTKLLDLMGMNPLKPQIFYGGGDSGGGGGGGGSDSGSSSSSSGNSFTETLANIFTPNDGASYVDGNLVDDATGASISAGGTTSTGNVISGAANTTSNDDNDNEPTRTSTLPATTATRPITATGVENSTREDLANLLTPFDGASYVNGQLVDDETGASLTGGGYSSKGDYIYGVSDDPSNNVLDTTGMDSDEISIATATQQMTEDLPPSDMAYFASFLPGMLVPVFGGAIGEQMLSGGIADRQSIIDQQVAALEMGATPQFDAQGNYVGFDDSTMSTFADQVLSSDNIGAFLPPSLPASSFNVTQTDIDQLRAAGLEDRANELQVGQTLNLSAFDNPAYSADANNDGINDYDRFQTVFGVQSDAANADPYGMSTENGFITSDGRSFYAMGDGSVQEVVDNFVPYNDAASGSSVNQVYGIDDVTISTAGRDENERRGVYGTRGTSEDYDRYSRGGGGYAFMPAYMRKYMTGENFDVMAQQITLADGSIAYQRPDGSILSPEQFSNTARTENALTVEGPDERYLQGYSQTGPDGLPIYFDAEGNPVDNFG